ncbi:hypothetical protein [Nocardia sp. NPDC057030]|uniref:hypothetical protein n=1 Tax=unclassified Nocardia TaxID=2637762 RepID=UPI0036340D1B
MAEMVDEALAQKKILIAPPRRSTRRTFDNASSSDDLAKTELLTGQIEFDTTGQAIPPVKSVLLGIEPHLTDHQIAAEDVVDDRGRSRTRPPHRRRCAAVDLGCDAALDTLQVRAFAGVGYCRPRGYAALHRFG